MKLAHLEEKEEEERAKTLLLSNSPRAQRRRRAAQRRQRAKKDRVTATHARLHVVPSSRLSQFCRLQGNTMNNRSQPTQQNTQAKDYEVSFMSEKKRL